MEAQIGASRLISSQTYACGRPSRDQRNSQSRHVMKVAASCGDRDDVGFADGGGRGRGRADACRLVARARERPGAQARLCIHDAGQSRDRTWLAPVCHHSAARRTDRHRSATGGGRAICLWRSAGWGEPRKASIRTSISSRSTTKTTPSSRVPVKIAPTAKDGSYTLTITCGIRAARHLCIPPRSQGFEDDTGVGNPDPHSSILNSNPHRLFLV